MKIFNAKVQRSKEAKRESEFLLKASNVTKIYKTKVEEVIVFRDLDLEIKRGETIAIIGASGTGKSTLLHILGGLDRPTSGSVILGEFDIAKSSEIDLARFRNRQIGFVFQFHHLLPEFSAVENVMMPLLIMGKDKRQAEERAAYLLTRVGLESKFERRPGELSGGEQQRVALARALVAKPSLLLADEPTGNLDQRTGDHLQSLLKQLQREENLTAIIVTHNEKLAESCDRVLKLEKAQLFEN